MSQYDVIVVGAGNAALAAAVSASENGAKRIVVIEKAPREMRGGNTHWSGGVLRFAYDDPREIGELLPDVEDEFENFYDGISPYSKDDYHGDLMRVTSGRTDPVLSKVLVHNSFDTEVDEEGWRHQDGARHHAVRGQEGQRHGVGARPRRARRA